MRLVSLKVSIIIRKIQFWIAKFALEKPTEVEKSMNYNIQQQRGYWHYIIPIGKQHK